MPVDEEERFQRLSKILGRGLGLFYGTGILLASLAAFLILPGIQDGSGLDPIITGLIILDMVAVYWIVSAIKPRYKIENMLPEGLLEEDFSRYFVPIFLIASDILVIAVADSDTILFPIIYTLFTLPLAAILIYSLYYDGNLIEDKLGLE